jgi:CheY-like chemotaxis protein
VAPPPNLPSPRLPKRILVVDDDPAVREMLARVLEGDGYAAAQAANGSEALRLAAELAPDLVLLDLGMPGKSGWETLSELNRGPRRPTVVIITARPDQATAARALGAAAHFEKPLDFAVLLQTVADLLAAPAGRTAHA